MRALSTILLVAALARPAVAQVFGAPREYRENALWLSAATGSMRAFSVSDRLSDATWELQKSTPVGVALDWGTDVRSVGVRVLRTAPSLVFEGASCLSCDGQVQVVTMLATFRRAAPLFTSGLTQIVEFGAGITNWSSLAGRNGHQIDPIASNNDFTYAVSIGAGLPFGDRLEGTVMYDVLMAKHELETVRASTAKSSGYIGMATLRFGARFRLGR